MNDLHSLFNAPQAARWDGPTLFISSSLDMRHVRQEICAALKGFLARTDTEVPLRPWEWESSAEERPYDQRLARQDDLGRPSHRLVAGTVCLLGERIGHPERGFDPATLPNWVDWSDPARPFRAQHPWPEAMAEQLAAVRAGAFPVSGTVFEALDALATGQPVYITYFADSSVLRGDAAKPLLNGQVWRNKQLAQLADEEARNWLATEYTLQTTAVMNFLRALSVRDRHVPFHRDKFAALESIQRFVLQHFGPTQSRLGNPYRFLDYYDVVDHADLVGREDLSREAADLIRARAHNPGTQAIALRLTGESGCGKTSFMRAGVLGALISAGDQGRFRVLAVRPTDFHDHSGQPDRGVIGTLLGIVAREFSDLTIQASELERLSRAGQRAPQLAVDALVRALAARDDAANRKFFVLGLDQFEEIVDDLAALERRPHARNWLPLLRFVELASQTDRFALVFTLESSRREAFGRLADRLPLTLREAVDIPLGSPSDAFLERVILRPFQRAGYRLAPGVVDALISGYRRYDGSTRRHASSLPLLALKLSNLFDHVHALRGHTRAERDRPGVQFEGESKDVGVDELGSVLSFDNDIEELATSAWTERHKNESDQLGSLDGLFQPLVALSGDDLEEITLQTVGNNVFVNASQQLDAFEQVRLVVRENGRRRLVHEAVVRQWPLAAKWLAQQRAYLIDEATLRTHANAWVLKGRDQARLPTDLASIALAATVLRHYRSAWPGTPGEDLPKRDQALREHCLAVFAKSEDPNVSDGDRFDSHWHHAHVAAIYGLTEVLERYIAREPQCVHLLTGGKRTPLHMAAWSTCVFRRT